MSGENSSVLRQIWNSPYTFWALLSMPAAVLLLGAAGDGSISHILNPTGEFAARFLIVALMIKPLLMLFPRSSALRWLMQRRRYLGVAAFGYAALHALTYISREGTLAKMIGELGELGIWTGWLAFMIFVPLVLTSNNQSVRYLGRKWKSLQRWVYAAAVFTLVHWMFVDFEFGPALIQFGPLAALEGWRFLGARREITA